ncbi:uncharacterized protein EDB91DRAFT_1172550 [Suillus paluster]|uniref:uncharacterized protein n=1 Tax=Suillus paluster TaxID=48578 RepID=UPI001B86C538|nr:uncharacterized protein EDB91DRAFT_1172550 [Suillus paluster]KAG1723535.1 hypothetical protein EDB91DRAFT_1172550 [Suillus paluster]
MAQLALPLVQAVASAIPLTGAPMQAAIGGLLTILQAIDRRGQNSADVNSLASRLHRLSCHFCNAPPAQDLLEQSRRGSLDRMPQGSWSSSQCCITVVPHTHPFHKLSPDAPVKSTVIWRSICCRPKCKCNTKCMKCGG